MIDEILDTVIHGDALAVLKTLPDECIDAIVCDPPSSINFMNKSWDDDKGGRTQWVAWLSSIMRECRRVLKPGGHALVWSLPRTSHWTALALEDAGFEIRDCLYQLVSGDTLLLNFLNSLSEEQRHAFMQVLDAQREPSGILHVFGSGFPKSANVSKLIDRMKGMEREVIGKHPNPLSKSNTGCYQWNADGTGLTDTYITKPATPESELWNGWGSALKPACENWWLVRKPLAASSIAENVLQYGTGAINVDASRISHDDRVQCQHGASNSTFTGSASDIYEVGTGRQYTQNGRFPSHLLLTHTPSCIQVGTKRVRDGGGPAPKLKTYSEEYEPNVYGKYAAHGGSDDPWRDEDGMETVTAWECPDFCPVRVLDEQSGILKTGSVKPYAYKGGRHNPNASVPMFSCRTITGSHTGDTGGASRYFQQLPALDDIPPYIYAGKASRRDRNAGCEGLPENTSHRYSEASGDDNHAPRIAKPEGNTHPTVKSQPLMRYLTRMICPTNGIVLDCFAGSGSTLVAAIHEGFHFIGIEKEEEYVEIASKRIQHAMSASGTQQPAMPLAPSVPTTVRKQHNTPHSSQLSLWDQEAVS